MSSNLDYVVSTLNEGDTVIAEFVSATHGHYSVSGKVTRKTVASQHKYVKVGGVIIAATPFQNHALGVKPVSSLNSITIMARAAKPFYANRPLERKPKNGDIAQTLYGERYYFDGSHFARVQSNRTETYSASEFTRQWGMPRLTSEAVA